MNNNRVLNENDMEVNDDIIIQRQMIFRDKKTGALLNIRRDDYVNDRLYFTEIMRVSGGSGDDTGGTGTRPLRYSRTYEELQSENNNT